MTVRVSLSLSLSGRVGFVIVMDCVGSGSAAAATMPAMLLTDCEFYANEMAKEREGECEWEMARN